MLATMWAKCSGKKGVQLKMIDSWLCTECFTLIISTILWSKYWSPLYRGRKKHGEIKYNNLPQIPWLKRGRTGGQGQIAWQKYVLFLICSFCLPNTVGKQIRRLLLTLDSANELWHWQWEKRRINIFLKNYTVGFIYLYCQSKIARIQQLAEYMWWQEDSTFF